MKKLKRIKQNRKFSEEFKQSRVQEYESGKSTVLDMCRQFDLHEQTIYRWIHKLSKFEKRDILIVESKSSCSEKLKSQSKQIRDLEQKLGQKQMQIEYLEKMIEIAKEQYGMDFKKNSNIKPLIGSEKIEQK